jgi:hypothetical protein
MKGMIRIRALRIVLASIALGTTSGLIAMLTSFVNLAQRRKCPSPMTRLMTRAAIFQPPIVRIKGRHNPQVEPRSSGSIRRNQWLLLTRLGVERRTVLE